MGVAIRSITEGIDRWERVAGPFPHRRWKRRVDGVLLRDAMQMAFDLARSRHLEKTLKIDRVHAA